MKLVKLQNTYLIDNTIYKSKNYFYIQIDSKRRTVIREHLHRCLSLDWNDEDLVTKLSFSKHLSVVWEIEFEKIEDLINLIPEEFL